MLRRISTHFNAFAESVLYRDVFLIDDASHEQATYYLMRRLSDPNDNISHYVRTLQVKSFQGDDESYCINTQLLLAALYGIHKLHFFRCVHCSIKHHRHLGINMLMKWLAAGNVTYQYLIYYLKYFIGGSQTYAWVSVSRALTRQSSLHPDFNVWPFRFLIQTASNGIGLRTLL